LPKNGYNEADNYWYVQRETIATEDFVKEIDNNNANTHANALRGTLKGVGAVRIEDISPIPHNAIEAKASIHNLLNLSDILGKGVGDETLNLTCRADGGITGTGTPTTGLTLPLIRIDNIEAGVYTLSASEEYPFLVPQY
jgi:hypothetical protein